MHRDFSPHHHWIFKTFLGGAAVLAVVVFVNVRTHADVTTPDNPNNNAPTATITSILETGTSSTVSTDAPLTLVAGSTVPVRVAGTFVDADGCSEVVTGGRVDALLQRGSVTTCITDGFSSEDGGNSCYAIHGCTITDCVGTIASFSCDFNVAYNADATDLGTFSGDQWTAFVIPLDATMLNSGSNDTNSPGYAAANFEVALSPGVGGGQDVSFGSVDLGSVTPEQILQVADEGNTPIGNVSFLMSPLLCRHSDAELPGATGTILPSDMYVSTIASSSIETMTAMSSDTPLTLAMDIPVATTSTVTSTRPAYLRINTPDSLIVGTCSGAITVGI